MLPVTRRVCALASVALSAVVLIAASPPSRPADALPGSRPAHGNGEIAVVWLVGPTDRYDHGVLGDGLEASGLRAVVRPPRAERSGVGKASVVEVTLPPDMVFEDVSPRLADVDGDGRDEIIVVRSRLDSGAALAVYRLENDGEPRLSLMAETAPLGTAHRWLNPIGVADFDGDGRPEIALVRTPHIGGVLEFHRFENGSLVKLGEMAGYSNHAIGSSELRLSAIADMDGDGIADVVLPTADRRAVAVVGFAGGTPRESYRRPVHESKAGPVTGPFSVISEKVTGTRKGLPPEVRVPLAGGGRLTLVGRKPAGVPPVPQPVPPRVPPTVPPAGPAIRTD